MHCFLHETCRIACCVITCRFFFACFHLCVSPIKLYQPKETSAWYLASRRCNKTLFSSINWPFTHLHQSLISAIVINNGYYGQRVTRNSSIWFNTSLTKILMSTHENLMRFSWENENCQRFSWESHELFTKSHENLTRFSFSRENWNVFSWDFLAFMSFSWDFSWVSHEILVSLFFTWKLERFLMRISWECHEILMSIFGRFLMKTLNMDSHEAEIFSRNSHESAVVSWAPHEILMRFSRDSHEIITRFSRDYHEILMRFSRDSGIQV